MVAAAARPGVSVAAIALANGLNANLLRRWIQQADAAGQPSFVPLALPGPVAVEVTPDRPEPVRGDVIRIEIRKSEVELTVQWPAASAAACGLWLQHWLAG